MLLRFYMHSSCQCVVVDCHKLLRAQYTVQHRSVSHGMFFYIILSLIHKQTTLIVILVFKTLLTSMQDVGNAGCVVKTCVPANRCNSEDGEEQTSIGQTSGGAREGHHSQGSDSLSFPQP